MKRRDLLKGLFGGAIAGAAGAAGIKIKAADAKPVIKDIVVDQPVKVEVDPKVDPVTLTAGNTSMKFILNTTPVNMSKVNEWAEECRGDYDFCDPDLSTHQFFSSNPPKIRRWHVR